MPSWLSWTFSILIMTGIFSWIGLSIYQKIQEIRNKTKTKNKYKKFRKDRMIKDDE